MSETSKKIQILRENNEEYEFYPTTSEIMEAMKKDIWAYSRKHRHSYHGCKHDEEVRIRDWEENRKKQERLEMDSILDIGAGDGRILSFFDDGKNYIRKKYGIEIARSQADDLIRKGIFIIGRNYYDVNLNDQFFSLIYSNPPFSDFVRWTNKLLMECNFSVLYLVLPVRWKNQEEITRELERYETTVVGEFDFSKADREARGRVNLIRVNAKWKEIKDGGYRASHQETIENAFERWIRENIADFEEKPGLNWEEESKQEIALRQTPIEQLITDYETEKENLGNAFRAIGKLDSEIIKLLGQDKASMQEIIRKAISGLKSKYWKAAFGKLDPVRERMTQETMRKIFSSIEEFRTLDFNADNIYSIVIWIIDNCNIGILDQICEVFDKMTTPEYIENYKSNKHWTKSNWRYTDSEWKYRKLPPRWKLGLDYRIVVSAHSYHSYSHKPRYTVVDDFMVVCRNLGFPIAKNCEPDYGLHQKEQMFYTEDGELAFSMRFYRGNLNAHLKINKKLLMKFNVEVAKIRKWMSEPDDVAEEYNIPKDEAVQIWNSGVALLGSGDVKMLEFKEAV